MRIRRFIEGQVALALVVLFAAAPAAADYHSPGDGEGPWADRVVSVKRGLTVTGDPVPYERSDPNAALGPALPPSDLVAPTIYSLGYRGELVLGFENPICNGDGPDFGVSITSIDARGGGQERGDVYVSSDRRSWTQVGDDVELHANLAMPSSIRVARFVRIVDTSFAGPNRHADGYDVDGVRALRTDCDNTPTADLELSVVDEVASPVLANDVLDDLVLRVHNEGPQQADEPVVQFTFIKRAGDFALNNFGGYFHPEGCMQRSIEHAPERVTWTCRLDAIAAGESRDVSFPVRPNLAFEVDGVFTVTDQGAADFDAADDSAERSFVVRLARADVEVSVLDALVASAPAGSTDRVRYRVTNHGPDPVEIPLNLDMNGDEDPPTISALTGCVSLIFRPAAEFSPHNWRCTLPALASGEAHEVAFDVRRPTEPGEADLEASVRRGFVDDPVESNDLAVMTMTTTLVSDLRATLTGPTSVSASSSEGGTFTATVTNSGPSSRSDVQARFTLSNFNGFAVLPANCTESSSGSTRTVLCSLGAVAAGTSKSQAIRLTYRPPNLVLLGGSAPPVAVSSFTIRATALPTTNDPTLGNNDSPTRTVAVTS